MPPLECDVITVPDFLNQPVTFELRALFFLASWLENVGPLPNLRLHLVCLGSVPSSVRSLAKQAGARVHQTRPPGLKFGATSDKLAGCQIEPTAKHFLLLDTDVIFLSDPSLPEEFAGSIAAAPANRPRIPLAFWSEIYDSAALPMPATRIPCRLYEAEVSRFRKPGYPSETREMAAMPPYYNGGAVFAPWGSGLSKRWAYYGNLVADWARATHPETDILVSSDMTGLALALIELQRAGQSCRRLPDPWHGILALLQSGRCRAADIKILHLIHFLRKLGGHAEVPREIERFLRTHGRAWSRPHGPLRGGAHFWRRLQRLPEIHHDCGVIRRQIEGLYRKWVLGALS